MPVKKEAYLGLAAWILAVVAGTFTFVFWATHISVVLTTLLAMFLSARMATRSTWGEVLKKDMWILPVVAKKMVRKSNRRRVEFTHKAIEGAALEYLKSFVLQRYQAPWYHKIREQYDPDTDMWFMDFPTWDIQQNAVENDWFASAYDVAITYPHSAGWFAPKLVVSIDPVTFSVDVVEVIYTAYSGEFRKECVDIGVAHDLELYFSQKRKKERGYKGTFFLKGQSPENDQNLAVVFDETRVL